MQAATTHPTLADLWAGDAAFVLDVADSGLPPGESDTIGAPNGELWSYLHASYASAGAIDQCGQPVPFPGCTVIYRSGDGGRSFHADDPPVCQFACSRCPCTSEQDHVDQQQYPRILAAGDGFYLVYEYRGRAMLRRSADGLTWSAPRRIAGTGFHDRRLGRCPPDEAIGRHPFATGQYDCLAGGPPGLYVEGDDLFIFVALGQNPASLGCFYAPLSGSAADFRRCRANPLFTGAGDYGPPQANGRAANPYFDFRTVSAAEVTRIGSGDEARYYLFYEGLRGPGPGDPGDTQFGLGLARSLTNRIDGPWEKYSGNPLLVDLPGNVGLGHADLLILDGQTFLYTSLDGRSRSRLVLTWSR